MTTANETAQIIPATVLAAFSKWINQSPKLDRREYGFDRPEGRAAYWDEVRSIRKDQARARKALREAKKYPFNAEAMAEALRQSFSGRLQWDFANNTFEYTAGQYFPTEYAPAAAAVLERYTHAVRPKFVPTEAQRNQWWTIGDIERASYNAGSHWFDPSTKRFFRSRILSEVYQGPGGIFFVTSEKGPAEIRAFTVREFNPVDADIDSFGDCFNTLTRTRAQRIAKMAAENRRAALEELGLRYTVRPDVEEFINWDTKYNVAARAQRFPDREAAQAECDKLNGITK